MKEDSKSLKAQIYRRTVQAFRLNKEACAYENALAKRVSKDCYPERDVGCFMKKARDTQEYDLSDKNAISNKSDNRRVL